LSKDDEDISFLADLPLEPTEPLGFSPDEMVRCDECLRANPPTRVECLYCGHGLSASDVPIDLIKPSLRPPEKWEQGYNCVLLKSPADGLPQGSIEQAASLLRLEADDLRQILGAQHSLPLARAATEAEAAIIEQRLAALGIETITVSDQALALEVAPPRRLRTLELNETGFVAFPIAGVEGTEVAWSAITLMVSGRLFARQMEFKERKRKGAEKEIVDATETMSDETVLDIYTLNHDGGWRITGNNFDFSCLAERKTLLARENFLTLSKVLGERALNAEHDDSYSIVRRMLELVWPSEQLTESRGWHRDFRGKYGTSELTVTTNEPQFTRYSHLCHFLKLRQHP
jgi:hypothetical protein